MYKYIRRMRRDSGNKNVEFCATSFNHNFPHQ